VMSQPVNGPKQKDQYQQADRNCRIPIAHTQQRQDQGKPREDGANKFAHATLALCEMPTAAHSLYNNSAAFVNT
jgi:hypothetical protein